jgi:hypothetical protein
MRGNRFIWIQPNRKASFQCKNNEEPCMRRNIEDSSSIKACPVVIDEGILEPLAELGAVWTQQQWQVPYVGCLPSKHPVQNDVLRCRRQPFLKWSVKLHTTARPNLIPHTEGLHRMYYQAHGRYLQKARYSSSRTHLTP